MNSFKLPKKLSAKERADLTLQFYYGTYQALYRFLRRRYGESAVEAFIQSECDQDARNIRKMPGQGAQKHAYFLATVFNVFGFDYEVVQADRSKSVVVVKRCSLIPIARRLGVKKAAVCFNDKKFLGPKGIFKRFGLKSSAKVGPTCVFEVHK